MLIFLTPSFVNAICYCFQMIMNSLDVLIVEDMMMTQYVIDMVTTDQDIVINQFGTGMGLAADMMIIHRSIDMEQV